MSRLCQDYVLTICVHCFVSFILREFFHICFSLQLHNPTDAITECNEALKIDENDVDALCDRAEAHILNEMYDDGMEFSSFLPSIHRSEQRRFLFIFVFCCDIGIRIFPSVGYLSRPEVRKNNLISYLFNVTQRGVYYAVQFLVTCTSFHVKFRAI